MAFRSALIIRGLKRTEYHVGYQKRNFFDKMKAAAKAFIANTPDVRDVQQSKKKIAGEEDRLLREMNAQTKSLGFFGGTIVKFVIKQMTKAFASNQAAVQDIIFNAAQLMEADPQVAAIFGTMLKVSSPSSQNVSHMSVNGKTHTEYKIVCNVSGSGGAKGRITVHAISQSGSDSSQSHTNSGSDIMMIDKLVLDYGAGTIDVKSADKGKGRRVIGMTTIDVHAK